MIRVPDPHPGAPTRHPERALVVPLDGATDHATTGRKAAALSRLARAGLPVPEGFVVPAWVDLALPELADEIARQLAALGGDAVAVRSSSVIEDLDGASFAGVYETVLDVRGTQAVVEAIGLIRESARTARATGYAGRHSDGAGSDAAMAVLVQRMVPADAAGVALTADPLTGDRSTVVVSAVRGLGDRLVAGEATADEWVVRGELASRRRTSTRAIDETTALQIAELARRIEALDGQPVDVEWAIVAGRPFVLQARPMTALPDGLSWDPGQPGVWLRDFRLGEWLGAPVTPLFESWALTRIEHEVDATLAALMGIRLPPDWPSHVVVNGWYFYGFNIMPASLPGLAGFIVRHLVPSLLRHPRQAVMAIPPLSRFGIAEAEREWSAEVLPEYQRLVTKASQDVETADPLALVDLVDRLAAAAGRYYVTVTKVAGYASKAEVPLAKLYRRRVAPVAGGSHLDLLIGLGDGIEPAAAHALRSLDWIEPTLAETTTPLDHEAARTRHAEARARRLAAEASARTAVESQPRLRREFERRLAEAQRFTVLREANVRELSLAWPAMRRAIARLGEHLVDRGVLDSAAQVHFLRRDEMAQALSGDDRSRSGLAAERERTWRAQARVAPPLRLGTMPPMFERLLADATEAVRGTAGMTAGSIVGIPASPGRATGPARVLHSLDEADRVAPGDVLVCPMTAPAWTALFGRIAAVVTDTGGVAAHASIVAREYGLPAVVGTGNATTRFADGELVEVDGATGVVRAIGD